MSTFTVLFELFSRYDNEHLNRRELYANIYEANDIQEVLQEIEDDQDFDDSEVIDSDHIDQLIEAGRNIIYVIDEEYSIVYSRESNEVVVVIETNIENQLDELDLPLEEYHRLSALPDEEKRNELDPYISHILQSFEDKFKKYFGETDIYVDNIINIEFYELEVEIIYKISKKIEVGKLEYLIQQFSEDFDGNVMMYDLHNECYANYRRGEVDSGGFLSDKIRHKIDGS